MNIKSLSLSAAVAASCLLLASAMAGASEYEKRQTAEGAPSIQKEVSAPSAEAPEREIRAAAMLAPWEEQPIYQTSYQKPAEAPPAWETRADAILKTAMSYIGRPYRYGAAAGDTSAFDCSSFVQHAFGMSGIYLPRVSQAQSAEGLEVPFSEMRKGDLVFFRDGVQRLGHVGIYMGDGKMIHASLRGVRADAIDEHWKHLYEKSSRILN